MVDVSPIVPAGRQVIEGYGDGQFRISGAVHVGSVLVFPTRTLSWPVGAISDISLESLGPVIEAAGEVDILLIGSGRSMVPPPSALRRALREKGVVIDPMDTGAACRTYNVLMAEERRVAAALIAV